MRTAELCTPHQTSRVCGPGAGVHTGPPGRSEGTRPSTPCSALLWPRSALHLPQCSRRLSTPGRTMLHGTQSPPRSLTPDRSVAVRCLPVAASPGLCPPAGPCLDSGVLGGCTQQAVSKCPIVFVTCGTAVGQACPRAAARLARGSWCGAGLTRRSAALELPGRSCPTAAQWREGTAALSSCVVTAGRFRASAACRPQPAAGAVRGSLFQACAKGSPSLLLPGCCLDGTLYSPRPQGA